MQLTKELLASLPMGFTPILKERIKAPKNKKGNNRRRTRGRVTQYARDTKTGLIKIIHHPKM
jgi:hypothetical protein